MMMKSAYTGDGSHSGPLLSVVQYCTCWQLHTCSQASGALDSLYPPILFNSLAIACTSVLHGQALPKTGEEKARVL